MTRSIRPLEDSDQVLQVPVLLQACQPKLTKHYLFNKWITPVILLFSQFSLTPFCSCSPTTRVSLLATSSYLTSSVHPKQKSNKEKPLSVQDKGLRDQKLFILCGSPLPISLPIIHFPLYFRSISNILGYLVFITD